MTDPKPSPDTPAFDATRIASGTGAGAPADTSPKDPVTRLGAYRVLKRLGGGGMGQIFLAVQETLQRQVAIKVLPQGALQHPEMIERFRREVKVLGQLSHANICPVVEAGVDNGTHYYVMEYLRGMDLARVMKTQRIDPRRAADIAAQVLRALHSAHTLGVIHRDVKPLNIMLQRGPRARSGKSTAGATQTPGATPAPGELQQDQKMPSPEWYDHAVLIDFGLARDSGSASGGGVSDLTVSGAVIGTPSYMAPEQARGDRKAISAQTDIYALGATLYEMLCMRPPFEGETVGQVLDLVRNAEPTPPRKINALVDRDLETIVLKSLEKEPARRYATAGEMADDLDRWLAGETIRARPASLLYRARKLVTRNPLASAAMAVALLLTLAGLWLALAPGTLEIPGKYRDAIVTVDGRHVSGDRVTIWPPGSIKVVVRVPGFHDWTSSDLEVGARATVTLDPKPVSKFGTLAVDTVPPGAEIWNGDVRLGVSPVETQVPTGISKLTIRLKDYEEEVLDRGVSPGEKVAVQRALQHQKGGLTLSSNPPEAAVILTREDNGEVTIAASPTTRFQLDTGRYRATARARNCFAQEFDVEVRAGEETIRNLTLRRMEEWSQSGDSGVSYWVGGDLTGDRFVDILTVTSGRVRAIDGRSGSLLWAEPCKANGPNDPWCQVGIGDLDGDLRPDAYYSEPGRGYVVLDPVTGKVRRELPVPDLFRGIDFGDMDGDGLTDFLCFTKTKLIATRGTDGAKIWEAPEPGESLMAEARLNDDGCTDFFAVTGKSVMRARDGRTGRELWSRPCPIWQLPLVADLDRDGIDDAVVLEERGRAAYSGRNGRELWVIERRADQASLAFVSGDIDGDGDVDLILSHWTAITVHEGSNGRQVQTMKVNSVNRMNLVLLDVTGDGLPELLCAEEAHLVVIDPRAARELWRFESDSTLAGSPLVADFNGDGRQDVAVYSALGRISMISVDAAVFPWRQRGPHMHTERVEVLPEGITLIPGNPHTIINTADARVLRTFIQTDLVYSTSARAADGSTVVAMDGDGPAILDVATGTFRWRKIRARTFTGPLLTDCNGDGVLDVVSGDEKRSLLEAFDGRNGDVLWAARDFSRRIASFMAATPGILWVPTFEALLALDPKSGTVLFRVAAGEDGTSAIALGNDVVSASHSGKVFRVRPAPGRNAAEIVWEYDTKSGIGHHSPSVSTRSVVCVSQTGIVHCFDTETGALRWRVVTDIGVPGTPAQQDLDGDGFPEVALPGFSGQLGLLDGATGRMVCRSDFEGGFGWNDPGWHDIDGDHRPELLLTCRDGWAHAISLRPTRPIVTWCRIAVRDSGKAVPATQDEAARIRIMDARRGPDWREILYAAHSATSAAAAFEGAVAALKLGDTAEFMKMEALARARGCRRLELELLKAGVLPEDRRVECITEALLAAPLFELRHTQPDAPLLGAWRAAGLAALARNDGNWERAVHYAAIGGDMKLAEELVERAIASGADRGACALALACAAFHLERWDDLSRHLKETAVYSSTLDEARYETNRLAQFGDSKLRAGVAAIRAGDLDKGADLIDVGLTIARPLASNFQVLAEILAHAPGATPALCRHAAGWAARGFEVSNLLGGSDEEKADILNTQAAASFLAEDVAEAVRVQTLAIEMAPTVERKGIYRETLKKYTEALKPK